MIHTEGAMKFPAKNVLPISVVHFRAMHTSLISSELSKYR